MNKLLAKVAEAWDEGFDDYGERLVYEDIESRHDKPNPYTQEKTDESS